jgi:DNA excision repair protein ERCC-3
LHIEIDSRPEIIYNVPYSLSIKYGERVDNTLKRIMISQKNPLIVQSDHTVLLEVHSPLYTEARNGLVRFAELIKSPEHVHTYRITPLSIWNACAAGVLIDEILDTLDRYTKYPIPEHIRIEIKDFASRYGRIKLHRDNRGLILETDNVFLAEELDHNKAIKPLLADRLSENEFLIKPVNRGKIKQNLIKIGYPADDLAGYKTGESFEFNIRDSCLSGVSFQFRPYQKNAAEIFHAGGAKTGGSGVIVMPCGAGKTIVGISCMNLIQSSTLILTTSVTAIRQWKSEILDKTTIADNQIGEYSGSKKEVLPITISTYQIMTYRNKNADEFPHLELFNERNWGLIIYDEVHMLPAPVFQITAGLQARRRLGLTATLVREDNKEDDVFALIGPKKVDIPWKDMESQGWIATAHCYEMRISLDSSIQMEYAIANTRAKFRIASENPLKIKIVKDLLRQHSDRQILLIGLYIDQLKAISKNLDIPIITGKTSQKKRDDLYAKFRKGNIRMMAVSKVANFAVDLPDVSVAIQISGTFGSRQEEAQRLGRILRPKPGENQAFF